MEHLQAKRMVSGPQTPTIGNIPNRSIPRPLFSMTIFNPRTDLRHRLMRLVHLSLPQTLLGSSGDDQAEESSGKMNIGVVRYSMLLLMTAISACLFLALSFAEIAGYKPVGARKPGPGPFFRHKPQMGSTLIGLACSGGGSRAAYLSAAILEEVHRSKIRLRVFGEADADQDLLDQIDYISSVSGGSVSASYFVLHKVDLRAPTHSASWDRYLNLMAVDFRLRQWYLRGLLNPLSWLKVLLSNYNRGNIAREEYDHLLYNGAKLSGLPPRPALYINASDIFGLNRFVFSNQPIYNPEVNDTRLLEARSARDLTYYEVDPNSITVADAVYASSAFPFAYPVLPLNDCLLRTTAHFDPNDPNSAVRFLADGGLLDNSGLLTLFNQFEGEFSFVEYGEPERPEPHLVLAILIDASIGNLNNINAYPGRDKTDYASHDTYLGQGTRSVEMAYDKSDQLILSALESQGVAQIESSYPSIVKDEASPDGRNFRIDSSLNTWPLRGLRSKELFLRPSLINLRLEDVPYSLSEVSITDPEFDRLLALNGLTRGNFASVTPGLLSEISTDFVLSDSHRHLLDLAAYVLVHGELEPRINTWAALAEAERKKQSQSSR
jgi:predicted acylesterase/phospholipase RssA